MDDACLVFVVAVALPATLVSLGLLIGRWVEGRPGSRMPVAAGLWVEDYIRRHGLRVTVEIVPAGSPDAYLPATSTLALSEATFAGHSPRDYAVAAHELGHAALAAKPGLDFVLPAARLVSALAWRLFVGALGIGLWLPEPVLSTLALGALLIAIGANVVVCFDEIGASDRASRLLRTEASVSSDAFRQARAAMTAAGSAYVLGLVGRVALLLVWPMLSAAVFVATDVSVRSLGHLGTWLAMLTLPVVAIRVALAVAQVVRPERMPSELDLWDFLQRDSFWESLAASTVVASLVVTHASLQGPVLAVAAAVAAAAALGQVQAVLFALVLLPRVVARRLFGWRPAPVRYPWRARADVPQAMVAMFTNPPWYLRALWLLPLGYLPLAALLFTRLL